jgi:hypothetical protein
MGQCTTRGAQYRLSMSMQNLIMLRCKDRGALRQRDVQRQPRRMSPCAATQVQRAAQMAGDGP